MMMKKLVTLGLGVMLSASLLTPVNASQVTEDTTTQVESYRKGKIAGFSELRGKTGDFKAGKMGEREPLSQEEHLAKLQERLTELEEKYEAGEIEEDRYENAKEKLTKRIEAVENGELPEMGKKKGSGERQQREPLSQEEMLEKLNDRLAKLEEAYSEGKIDEDRYEKSKEHLTGNIEKVENGEMPTRPEAPTQEEMLEKLNEKLADLDTKLNDGDITEDQYNTRKERLETMIEKVENGDLVSLRQQGKKGRSNGKGFGDFVNLTKEEKIEMLQEKLTQLETALNEARIDQEKYDAVKTATETLIEKIQNDEELTDMKNIYKTREAKSL